jgi:uncharacterized repeat protein (TIGR03803 family)
MGNYPSSILQGQDGYLYGTADNGPFQGGVVWKLGLGGDYSLLHAFSSATGYFPEPLAQDSEGLLYGAIVGFPQQQLFCLSTNGSITNIGAIPDYYPRGLVLGADGNFYGTSWLDGEGGEGSVWAMNRNGRLVRLVSFDTANGASLRSGPLLGGDGRLYGTTEYGGPNGGGVVYSLSFSIPEIIAQPLPQGILQNGSGVFDVIVFSTNSVTYQWNLGGVDIPGATNATYVVTNAQSGDFGVYSVAITSGGKSVTSSNALLTLLPPNPIISVSQLQGNLLLEWPAAYSGFGLEQSSDLTVNAWNPVSQTVSSNAGMFSVAIPVSPETGATFYRLKK